MSTYNNKTKPVTYFVEQINTKRDEVTRAGTASTLDGAIEIAKRIVDEYLWHQARYEASPDDLYTRYQESGIIPCIFKDDSTTLNVPGFDHFEYASLQCVKMSFVSLRKSAPAKDIANSDKTFDTGRYR